MPVRFQALGTVMIGASQQVAGDLGEQVLDLVNRRGVRRGELQSSGDEPPSTTGRQDALCAEWWWATTWTPRCSGTLSSTWARNVLNSVARYLR